MWRRTETAPPVSFGEALRAVYSTLATFRAG
jgi:hypothetical protein